MAAPTSMQQPTNPLPAGEPSTQGGEGAAEVAERLVGLRGRLGLDQVQHALGRRKVQATVQHGAAGELARFRRPGPEGDERRGDAFDDGGAAMQVELGSVFAGVGSRAGQPEDDRLIQQRA